MENRKLKTELLKTLKDCQQQAESLELLASDDSDREAAADAKHYLMLAMRALGDVEGGCRAIII